MTLLGVLIVPTPSITPKLIEVPVVAEDFSGLRSFLFYDDKEEQF